MSEQLQDLDPQEAIEAGYDEATDIDTDTEVAEATTPQDEQYTPELDEALPGFDTVPWPGDRLIIVNDDGGFDDEDDEKERD